MKIKITLKEGPVREIEMPYNPTNKKLEADLVAWLNLKLAENS
jgi:hypothetical protein